MMAGLGTLAASAALARAGVAQTPAPIRVAAVAADSYAEPFYALDLGVFKRNGLDAQVVPFPNGAAMAAALAGGTVDVGVGDVVATANAIGHGLPFTMIAGAGLYETSAPTTLLCVAKDSPIQNAKALEGQTVAVISLVSLSSAAVKAWLSAGGADLSAVKFVELGFGEMPAALARGTVGAAFIAEPVLSSAAAQSATRVLGKAYDAVAAEFAISVAFTTRDWLAHNPAAAAHFVRSLYDTARIANAHPEQTAPILATATQLDAARIATITRSRFATSFSPALIAPVLDVAHRYNVMPNALKAADAMTVVAPA
jgi:NitT/TauT family transport system substrate-binding protein